jgi:hypothetical protein
METEDTLSNEMWRLTLDALHGINLWTPQIPKTTPIIEEESQQIRSVLLHRTRNGITTRSRTELG